MLLLPLLLWALPTVRGLQYRAADFSSLILVESEGVNYTDYGIVQPFEHILAAHGCNTARVRVWTAGQYDLEYSLAMAKRVKDAGMTLIVDLHYSDTWADPGHQATPSGWPTDLEGLMSQMYNYTAGIVSSFAAQGTPIDILQTGNEINSGLLWPVGDVSVNGLEPVSLLLQAANQGARSVNPSQPILIHLANGWDWDDLNYWYTGVFNTTGGLTPSEVDIMGVSFYPFYGTDATLANLSSSLYNLTSAYGKPVVVAETDWPAVCNGTALSEPSVPVSAYGQEEWSRDIEDVLLSLPDGFGQGIFYWEPGWIGNAALGSSCADNLLVTPSGETRQSINIFGWDMSQ